MWRGEVVKTSRGLLASKSFRSSNFSSEKGETKSAGVAINLEDEFSVYGNVTKTDKILKRLSN